MRSLLLAGGLAAALTLPAFAHAQTRCQREEDNNRVAGTVLGAGVGALAGSAIAGRGAHTEGAIVGGIAGAVAGNQLAAGAGQPCPPGYYEAPTAAPLPPPPVTNRFWIAAPADVRDRIDFLENRIRSETDRGRLSRSEADQAYRDLNAIRRSEADMRARDGGALTPPDRDYLQARLDTVGERVRWAGDEAVTTAPAPPPPPPRADRFWSSAPADIRDRIDFLEARIRNGVADGALTRGQAAQAYRDLADIRRMEINLRQRDDGDLNGTDRDYLQARLDTVGRNVHWAERASNDYGAR